MKTVLGEPKGRQFAGKIKCARHRPFNWAIACQLSTFSFIGKMQNSLSTLTHLKVWKHWKLRTICGIAISKAQPLCHRIRCHLNRSLHRQRKANLPHLSISNSAGNKCPWTTMLSQKVLRRNWIAPTLQAGQDLRYPAKAKETNQP